MIVSAKQSVRTTEGANGKGKDVQNRKGTNNPEMLCHAFAKVPPNSKP